MKATECVKRGQDVYGGRDPQSKRGPISAVYRGVLAVLCVAALLLSGRESGGKQDSSGGKLRAFPSVHST